MKKNIHLFYVKNPIISLLNYTAMKNFKCIVCISIFIFLSAHQLSGQKLIRTTGYYIEDENEKNQLISRHDALKLLYYFQESKEYYKYYQGLMVISKTTAVGSLPFLWHYAIYKAFSGVNLGGSILGSGGGEDEVNTTPLFIGVGFLAIGIFTGIASYSNFTMAIDSYNEKAGFNKAENHTLRISTSPGSTGMVYSF